MMNWVFTKESIEFHQPKMNIELDDLRGSGLGCDRIIISSTATLIHCSLPTIHSILASRVISFRPSLPSFYTIAVFKEGRRTSFLNIFNKTSP